MYLFNEINMYFIKINNSNVISFSKNSISTDMKTFGFGLHLVLLNVMPILLLIKFEIKNVIGKGSIFKGKHVM